MSKQARPARPRRAQRAVSTAPDVRRLSKAQARIEGMALTLYASSGVPADDAREEMEAHVGGLVALYKQTGNPLWLWRAILPWCVLLPRRVRSEPSEVIIHYLMQCALELKNLESPDSEGPGSVAEVILESSRFGAGGAGRRYREIWTTLRDQALAARVQALIDSGWTTKLEAAYHQVASEIDAARKAQALAHGEPASDPAKLPRVPAMRVKKAYLRWSRKGGGL